MKILALEDTSDNTGLFQVAHKRIHAVEDDDDLSGDERRIHAYHLIHEDTSTHYTTTMTLQELEGTGNSQRAL